MVLNNSGCRIQSLRLEHQAMGPVYQSTGSFYGTKQNLRDLKMKVKI